MEKDYFFIYRFWAFSIRPPCHIRLFFDQKGPKKGRKIGHFWVISDHFWVDPGSLWGHLGMILASFWHHFGVVLVSFWSHFEAFFCLFLGYFFWTILGHFSPILAISTVILRVFFFWRCFGKLYAKISQMMQGKGNICKFRSKFTKNMQNCAKKKARFRL